MSAPIPARWYMVDAIGLATLCANEADARRVAEDTAIAYPANAPYRAVLLGDVAAERERCADLAFVMVSKYLPTSPCRDALSRVSAAIRKGDAA